MIRRRNDSKYLPSQENGVFPLQGKTYPLSGPRVVLYVSSWFFCLKKEIGDVI